MIRGFLQTGQVCCYDTDGREIDCAGTGQDGELQIGAAWPAPRFTAEKELVTDQLTSLIWPRNANLTEFPLSWQEALDYVREMNERDDFGFSDWRLPNRRELRSLISYQTRRPALPADHPFANVILNWYWTSTTAAIHPAYAWYVHMDGARMFYGKKDQYCLVWPVRGRSSLLPDTGQKGCFDAGGGKVECPDAVQDGARSTGLEWPEERFAPNGIGVLDRLTGLEWHAVATLANDPVSWPEAFALVRKLNEETDQAARPWRVPTINELESLVDCAFHSPALPGSHPFTRVQDVYWSSTTSYYEPDWSWALYLVKGALGVGVKKNRTFYVWPVREGMEYAGTP